MSACPPDEAWAAFPKAVGAAEHQALVQHLAACSACRAVVAELARQGAIAFSETIDSTLPAVQAPVTTTKRLGRFSVLDVLGEGGMGTVLSAYDPRLDRRVALKVLRGATARSAAGHARLLREAQALARIAHPHVVPVHEVAELDGEVVLVMEHVPGQTLQDWVRAGPPPWREIVRAYVQAGRGLAAVHAAGFVHRDFKPSNALIGADGRVRVIDFGLVREELTAADEIVEGDGEDGADGADGADRLTHTGTVLGTPAYMAPEQFERADVGPRTDVYAFCVSLSEALYGVRPFVGRRPGFAAGEGNDPPSAAPVPRRVWTVLRKGLSAAADDRPRSIEPLLDELNALIEPPRRKWIAAAVMGTSLAGIAIGWLALPGATPEEQPCSGGAAELARIWSETVAGDVTRRLVASGSAYGEQVAPRVVGTLTSYTRDWTLAHRDACMAHRRGEQSAALLDRRMYCLDRHRQALASTVDLLVHDDAPGDPVRLVLGLPPIVQCSDLDEVSATAASTADPALDSRAHSLEGQLERAAALERNGDYMRAGEVAAQIVRDAEPLEIEPLQAAANLQLGRARLLSGELAEADQPLRAALRHAIAADAPAVAVEAIARRIYVAGMTGALDQTRLAELRSLAEDFLQRTRDGAFAHALLLNNVGVIHRSLGQREVARDVLRKALEVRGAVARPEMEMSVIVENLAAVTDDPVEREALYARAVREAESSLGEQHPETLRSRLVQAAAIRSPLDRRTRLTDVCTAWTRFHPRAELDRAMCEQAAGDAEQEIGHADIAAVRFTQAAALYGSNQPLLAEIARAHAEQLAKRSEPARIAIEAARAHLDPAATHPWAIALRAELDTIAADLAARAGNHREAMRLADAAIATLGSIDLNAQLQWQVIAARARVTAAQSRLALGGARRHDEAIALLELAQRWYRSAGSGYEARLEQLARSVTSSAAP
ncbi:MAG: protein kinase [Kofleriaceae bacterium]